MTSRRRFRRSRQLISASALFALAFGSVAPALATPVYILDLRVRGTGAKEAVVNEPGDTVVLDLFIRANGQDANPGNDGMQNMFSSFRSSAGGLIGDLIGLPPPAPFNNFASSPGKQNDLDGDGDLDVGSFASDGDDYYFSRGGPNVRYNQPAGGFHIASIRFTALALNAESTEVNWLGRNNDVFGLSIAGVVDGTGYGLNGATSPLVQTLAPVVIRAASVGGGGTTELISGTINSHLLVDHTFRQGAGDPVTLANGMSVVSGGLFDMRNAQGGYAGQEIRVNDLVSSNNGGAVFVDRLIIGAQSSGQFSQQRGLTQVGSTLRVGGSAVGSDGTLLVSGGTMRGGQMQVGGIANGHVGITGGYLTVDDLDLTGTTTGTALARVGAGALEITNSGTIGSTAGTTNAQLLIDGGEVSGGGLVWLHHTASGAPAVHMQSGRLTVFDVRMSGGASVQQDGGYFGPSALALGHSFASNSAPATYTLDAGTLSAGLLHIGEGAARGTLRQNGGTLLSGGIVGVYDTYELADGQAQLWGIFIDKAFDNLPARLEQSGGTLTTDYLTVRGGTYRITGGTFQVNKELRIQNGGTIDFGNGLGALTAGQNSLIEIPAQGLVNTASASLIGKTGSLINYQPGQDPRDRFGNVQIEGLLHEQGTPLHIPASKSVTGAGNIIGNVTNDGALNPGYVGGVLDITGNYIQSNDAKITFELAGNEQELFDTLTISGTATLDGMLEFALRDNFRPLASDVFMIISSASLTGRFDNPNNQVFFGNARFDIQYSGSQVFLRNFATVPEPGIATALLAFTVIPRRRRR